MRLMRDSDYKTFEQLCACTQGGLKATMSKYLRTKYKNIIETKDYICAEGDIPIALVAHMDTVFKTPAMEVYYDRQKNVIWSPYGLGADDRAGVFAIIQIIKQGLRPHIILTTDEECGALGATKLAAAGCPFEDLRYVIQLDRRGACDCVFYDCDNQKFIEYVEDFGFVEAIGSFSDISMLCPAWQIAGVNLSVGYYNEHSVSETLQVGHLLSTIDKVANMLREEVIPSFVYIKAKRAFDWYHWIGKSQTIDDTHCSNCHREFKSDELIPVKMINGLMSHYCVDCISDASIDFCNKCGEAYEKNGHEPNEKYGMCEDCFYDGYYNY